MLMGCAVINRCSLRKRDGELGEIHQALSWAQLPREKSKMGTVVETEKALLAVGLQALFRVYPSSKKLNLSTLTGVGRVRGLGPGS